MENDSSYGKGSFLIANPVLPDPNFSRTVVLLCSHNEEGSFGLVVNRSADLSIADIFSDEKPMDDYPGSVYVGGPVAQSQVFFLCRSDVPLEELDHVCDDVYLGMKWESLEEVLPSLKNPEQDVRFYMGYSGWAAGQLEHEMEHRSWLTCNAQGAFVFAPDEDGIWANVVRSMGQKYEYLTRAPENPQWN